MLRTGPQPHVSGRGRHASAELKKTESTAPGIRHPRSGERGRKLSATKHAYTPHAMGVNSEIHVGSRTFAQQYCCYLFLLGFLAYPLSNSKLLVPSGLWDF